MVKVGIGVAAMLLVLAGGVLGYARLTGLSARPAPASLEADVAGFVRGFAIPPAERQRPNPVPVSDDAFAQGLAHFADHCAVCHGNDGAGRSETGRGLFPRPPDMRGATTQALTDGELFYVIENGVRFTGMPAFGTGTAEGEAESWRLVHFIRRLPQLSDDDREAIAALVPRSPTEVRQEIKEDAFLKGEQP